MGKTKDWNKWSMFCLLCVRDHMFDFIKTMVALFGLFCKFCWIWQIEWSEVHKVVYTLLISVVAILNFKWMKSFAERSYTWAKWLPKMKPLLTLLLQCVHIKRNVFSLYQEEYFLYTMSLWVCYLNFKAFVQRYSWIDDVEGKRELI